MFRPIYLLLICCSFVYSLAAQTTIDRGPYLQQATTSGITIQWRTETPTQSFVWYGTTLGNLSQTIESSTLTENHSIQLSGLNNNTTYYYAVGDNSGMLAGNNAEFYFKTHPPIGSNTAFRVWVQGDAGVGNQTQRDTRDGFLSFLGNDNMDLMLMLGDNGYSDGKQNEYQDALFENMYENIMNKVVLWPTLGNHDSYSTNASTRTGPYYDIFTLPKNAESGGSPSGTESYYSYDYANAHFVVLNSEDEDRSPTGAMAQWIAADLSATSQDWIIAYFHHPIYSGAHNNESDDAAHEKEMRENILPILEAHGVDLVLFGHTHNYQRSFLVKGHYGPSNTFDPLTMTIDGGTGRLSDETPYEKVNDDGGAVFVCIGNAAKLEDEPEEDLNHPTTVIGRDIRGSASLEINGDQLDFKFVLQDGIVEDHFTILKSINPLTVSLTNPANGTHYPNLQNIYISANATDPGGSVSKVEFFVNGTLVGTDFNAPFTTNWHPFVSGAYSIKATATDNEGLKKSITHHITVGQTSTACVAINQSSDDAEQRSNGTINLTSSTLEIVEDGSDHQIIGLRFNNLNIPRGAAIANSFLKFTVKDDSNKNPCALSISGQTGNNILTFAGNNNNLSIRPRTNNSITWSPGNWSQANSTQSTVDIGAIIQEIVLQDAYTPSQSVILFIEGEGERNASTFDQANGSSAPELCITFDPVNCLDKDFDGTCDIDDICLNGPEPGQNCNDNNPSTFEDKVNNNCVCIGTLYDCVNLNAQFGSPCNDNNSGTFNDIVTLNCECKGTPYDCPALQAQFGSPCNDNNPGTFNDIITTNCTCAGTPYDCPALQAQFGSPCNDNNPFTCQDVIGTNCLCAGTPTNVLFTKTSRIDQNSDDAEQRFNGSVTISSDDLELIRDASNQIVGLRFDNPGIAPGSILSSAYIHFTVDETNNTNPCNLTIYGEKNIASATFSASANNISTRIKTSSSASWSPGTWSAVGDNGLAQRSSNIAPVLQEIISLNGYTANTPFTIIIEGEGRRVAVAHDKSALQAPLLSVSYQVNLPDSDGDGVCNAEDQCVGPEPGSPCNDANPQTFDDEVNLNCICVGKPYGCPTLLANVGDACNDFNPQTYNDIVTANCVCQGSPIVQSSLCVPISNSADDAEQKSNGSCSINSSDLELAKDGGDTQLIGLRFRNLDLQQGTIIGESYLQFTVDKNNNVNPCALTIRGELNSNPAVFNITNNNIGNRALTAASVLWSPSQWSVNGESAAAQRTPNIQSIIQEIVNQPGFNENSALALIITGEGLRQAVAFDLNSNNAAELCMNVFAPPTTPGLVVSDNGITSDEGRLSEPNKQEEIAIIPSSSTANNTITTSYLKVYPNPAQNNLTVSFDVLEKGLVRINVLDMNGQLLAQVQSDAASGQNEVSLNLADLPNGLYFLSLQTDSERRVAKFSVLR